MGAPNPENVISHNRLTRALIYSALILFALYSLLPLYVMLVNSLKPLDEIRQGGMLNLPQTWTVEPWLSPGRRRRSACSRRAFDLSSSIRS